ncbi:hypothetical protein [Halobacteriaceae bacterium SHR40]|uniref:hypothetical protein n=1 Tax=Halovenus amylolytica TaxID=2500550 RepID=UPI000FE2F2E0
MSYGRTQPSAGPVEGAIHGAVVYLGLSLGLFLTTTLSLVLGEDSLAVSGSSNKLFFAAQFGFEQLLVLAPLLAVGLAVYYVASDRGEPAFVTTAVAGAVGTLLAGLVMLILMIALAPDLVDVSLGDELPVLLAYVLGSAIAGGVSAIGLDIV